MFKRGGLIGVKFRTLEVLPQKTSAGGEKGEALGRANTRKDTGREFKRGMR